MIIGSSGSGKTNLMMRLWAGWYAAAHTAHARREGNRPLLVVLDCKGGPDARVKAGRTRRLLHGTGARRVAIWPDEARLCLWHLPPRDLGVLLLAMIETGDGAAAYYTDIMQAVVNLALAAPGGPPANAASFLDRLDVAWLEAAYGDGLHGAALSRIRAARPHVGRHPAPVRDPAWPARPGPGRPRQPGRGRCLVLHPGRHPRNLRRRSPGDGADRTGRARRHRRRGTERRAILLAADDYSAVSRRVPISNLYERGRSLGLGVQVSAQSWQGLGRDEDERYRIAATADGGIWLMQTPHPEPVVQLAGTRRVLESAHKLIGATWGDEGTTRTQHAWVADPDLIRTLDTGQACYIRRGGATFVQVARPETVPAVPPRGQRHPPVIIPPPAPPLDDEEPSPPEPGREPGTGSLDDVLGPEASA